MSLDRKFKDYVRDASDKRSMPQKTNILIEETSDNMRILIEAFSDLIKEHNNKYKEFGIILEAISTLVEKVDQLTVSLNDLKIPAPIINLTVPESKKTTIRTIERDEQGFIKAIKENVEENYMTEKTINLSERKK